MIDQDLTWYSDTVTTDCYEVELARNIEGVHSGLISCHNIRYLSDSDNGFV